jgi:hypothetical protein
VLLQRALRADRPGRRSPAADGATNPLYRERTMPIDCDPGYPEPFLSLCRQYPGADVYSPDHFRVEWGPIFHRGRLDGTARCLVIGQDPAQNENIVRRILVGVAGQRTQGLLKKLGLTRSYVLVNTFLYSVYGSGQSNAEIVAYRNKWISGILDTGSIEAVLALGTAADGAWTAWKNANPTSPKRNLPFAHVTHPTQPESSSGGDAAKHAQATTALLQNWNAAITALSPSIQHPDMAPAGPTYGTNWAAADFVPIPAADLPPGTPDWMGNRDHWATRAGATAAKKRANITITVPASALPAATVTPHVAPHIGPRSTAPMALPLRTAERANSAVAGAGLLALTGTVVTMTSPSKVLAHRTVYIREGIIEAIRESTAPRPSGFEAVTVLNTQGLIFPGFIELHNHLAYNVLPLWSVPKTFANRDQWSGLGAYRQLISGPMGAISAQPGVLAALCRYVECKAMLGGATTSQGIALVNHNNIRTFFRGLLRNAELTDDPNLPAAHARIGDVMAKDRAKFGKALAAAKACYLLHLSEGTNAAARTHFEALRGPNDQWALAPALAGIHCVALTPADFQVMADHGSAMVWSPLSNLLLYGATANVQAAKDAKLRIGLGPDWSPSGSKNMLGELKAARAYSKANGDIFSDEELVAMATRHGAEILFWQSRVGTVEEGKVADLVVVRGSATKPYGALIEATEQDIKLLVVGGVRRFGTAPLMAGAGPEMESIEVGGESRTLNLWLDEVPDSDGPQLEQLTLKDAAARLKGALGALGSASPATPHLRRSSAALTGGWTLALDEVEHTGEEMRPLIGLSPKAARHGVSRPLAAKAAVKLSPIDLDPLTVPDDPGFLKALVKEPNLPKGMGAVIAKMY